MSDPVKMDAKVVGAQFNFSQQCFVFLVENEGKRFYTQVGLSSLLPNVTNLSSFSKAQLAVSTDVFCHTIVGKTIKVVFDPDLNSKIAEHYPLEY